MGFVYINIIFKHYTCGHFFVVRSGGRLLACSFSNIFNNLQIKVVKAENTTWTRKGFFFFVNISF